MEKSLKDLDNTKRSVSKSLHMLDIIREIKEKKEKKERERKEEELNKLINEIKSLIPRMIELKKVLEKMYLIGIPNDLFFTEKYKEVIGFYYNDVEGFVYNPKNQFGVAGGNIYPDLIIDLQKNSIRYGKGLLDDPHCHYMMKKIIDEFNLYEEDLIKEVNNYYSNITQ